MVASSISTLCGGPKKTGSSETSEYVPVHPVDGQSSDVAIAKAAEAGLRSDLEAGLVHRLMVRTDSKVRAGELASTYAAHTALKLR